MLLLLPLPLMIKCRRVEAELWAEVTRLWLHLQACQLLIMMLMLVVLMMRVERAFNLVHRVPLLVDVVVVVVGSSEGYLALTGSSRELGTRLAKLAGRRLDGHHELTRLGRQSRKRAPRRVEAH